MEKNPRHRPKRQFEQVKRKLCQLELEKCPYCESKLKSTSTLYIDKQVQTLGGVVNVRAYGYYCSGASCSHPEKRYRAVKEVMRISLPMGTYGLDVIAYIGWQRDREHRQMKEIRQALRKKGVKISERHVGRLYRQYLALLAGMNDDLAAKLKETEAEYGGVIWALDGLQPDKNGPQLYVLYEVLGGRVVGAAWLDKKDTMHLAEWLKPYGQMELKVLATLSDGEKAEIGALEGVWSKTPHQMCHTHFLGDIAQPIREGDKRLRARLVKSFGQFPPVPGNEVTAQARPKARTLELLLLAKRTQNKTKEPASKGGEDEETSGLQLASQGPPQVRLKELEGQFRAAFRDAFERPSRKPSTFGGLAGYEQVQSLVIALQSQLPQGHQGPLQTLLEQGQQALQESAPLAQEVRQAQGYLGQITHLLFAPFNKDPPAKQTLTPAPAKQASQGQQVKQALQTKLTALANQPRQGSISQAFLTNTQRLTTKWEAYLFHCYDIPGLPASNTALEARFNALRRGQRRVSGQKDTSALRRGGHFQILLRAADMTELWQRLGEVSLSAYHAARERLEAAEERQRWVYRLHRWPLKTAISMVSEYLKLHQQLNSAQPAGP